MSSPKRERIQELFLVASELEGDARRKYLDDECAGDEALRREVESLLEVTESQPDFLATPASARHRGWFDESETVADNSARSIDAEDRPEQIADYRVIDTVGEGGMGVVYLAEQPPPLRGRVAIKLIKLGMDSKELVARFDAEREALSLMSHSGIARVFDAGVAESGRPYFVMEYVDGEQIIAFCDRVGVSLRDRLKLFCDVCKAVQHAHQKAVIHRDLKPSNLLVTKESGKTVPKIIDFGVAKATGPEASNKSFVTQHGRLIGTPEYMSPEQATYSDADLDTRTDIYSLGVVLYELLVGELPFVRPDTRTPAFDEVLRMIRDSEAPRPTTRLKRLDTKSLKKIAARRRLGPDQLVRELRGDLEWIVGKALEKDRSRRYATASEFAADVARYLRGEPVEARPASAAYRIRKFVERHRAGVLAASVVAVGLCVSLTIAVLAYFRSEEARLRVRDALSDRDSALTLEKTARTRAEGLRLSAQARSAAAKAPESALLLGLEAAERYDGKHACDALLDVLDVFVPMRSFGPHAGLTISAALAPDGKHLVTSAEPADTRVWDLENGKELRRWPGLVTGLRWSPDGLHIATWKSTEGTSVRNVATGEVVATFRSPRLHDYDFDGSGTRIAGATRSGTVFHWALDGEPRVLHRFRHGQRASVARFSPSNRQILTASEDKSVRLWNAETGELVRRWTGKSGVQVATFGAKGRRVFAGDRRGFVSIWDVESGESLHTLKVPSGVALDLRYGERTDRLLVASLGGFAFLYDGLTGELRSTLAGHLQPVRTARFDPEEQRVVTASTDGTARVWNAETGDPLTVLPGHRRVVHVARYSDDGTKIVTASHDGMGRVWSSASALQQLELSGHTKAVYAAGFHPTGLVATAGRDASARIWSVDSRDMILHYKGHPQRVYRVVFVDEQRCISTSSDGSVHLWTLGGETLRVFRGHTMLAMPLDVSLDRKWAASGSEDRTVRVWSLETEDHGPLLRHKQRVYDVRFSADGRSILTASANEATLWSLPEGLELRRFVGHSKGVKLARFVGQDRVVTGSDDGTLRLWTIAEGEKPRVFSGHRGAVLDLSVSPNQRMAVSGSSDHTARIWNLGNGESTPLEGHEADVVSVAFRADSRFVLTAAQDATARVWDAATGELWLKVRASTRLFFADFSPDGEWILTAAEDGQVHLWPHDVVKYAKTFRHRDFTPAEREEYEVPEQ
ncbi:MAG: serine/threonine-protein kinase [Planctomycetota bacterium]